MPPTGVNAGSNLDPVVPPLFVTAVAPGSGAARAGIKPGDEVHGVPPIVSGKVPDGVVDWLTTASELTLRFTLRRPIAGKTFTTTASRVEFPHQAPKVEAKLLRGDVAYVTIPGFYPGVADQALAAIADLGKHTAARGIILALRGNGGGSGTELARMLGAFVHGRTTGYWCDVRDRCTANSDDVSVAPQLPS